MASVEHTHSNQPHTDVSCPVVIKTDASLEVELIDDTIKMHIADDMNGALKWCEDHVAVRACPAINPIDPLEGRLHIRQKPEHLRQMYFLYHDDDAVTKLLG